MAEEMYDYPRLPTSNDRQSPVVTEGAAGSRQPYGDFFSAYERMQQLRQPQSSGGFFDFTPAQQSALDRLGALGAAMASTRSPTFAGAFGEGLQAMQRTAASQRQEERQNRQLDVEAAYRAAQEARQMAEFEYARDPTNPINQLRVAQRRREEAQAEAVLMNARTAAAGPRLQPLQGEFEGRPAIHDWNTGRTIQAPEGFRRAANVADDRARTAITRDIIRAGEAAARGVAERARAAGSIIDPARLAEEQRAAAREERRRAAMYYGLDPVEIERQAAIENAGPGGGGNAPRGPNPVIDSTTGRPIAP